MRKKPKTDSHIVYFDVPYILKIIEVNNNYSPKWRWLVVIIYRRAKQRGKYPPPLATDTIVLVYNYFEKGCPKNVDATTPKGNMGYDQYTVP